MAARFGGGWLKPKCKRQQYSQPAAHGLDVPGLAFLLSRLIAETPTFSWRHLFGRILCWLRHTPMPGDTIGINKCIWDYFATCVVCAGIVDPDQIAHLAREKS